MRPHHRHSEHNTAKSCTCVTFSPCLVAPMLLVAHDRCPRKKYTAEGYAPGKKREGRNALELEERGKKRQRPCSSSSSTSSFFHSLFRSPFPLVSFSFRYGHWFFIGRRNRLNSTKLLKLQRELFGERCFSARIRRTCSTTHRDDAGERRNRGSVTLRQCDRERGTSPGHRLTFPA